MIKKIQKVQHVKRTELLGWIGLGLLQSNSIPAVLQAVDTGEAAPISTIVMTIAGLACYMARAIADKDFLYMTGNTIGLIGNTVLLVTVLTL